MFFHLSMLISFYSFVYILYKYKNTKPYPQSLFGKYDDLLTSHFWIENFNMNMIQCQYIISNVQSWVEYLERNDNIKNNDDINNKITPKFDDYCNFFTKYLELVKYYDESFDDFIIMSDVLQININKNDFFNILMYLMKKSLYVGSHVHHYLMSLFDTIINTRNNIFLNDYSINHISNINYYNRVILNTQTAKQIEIFKAENLKNMTVDKNYGISNIVKYTKKRELGENNCHKYFVEILNDDFKENILSMIITRNNTLINTQVHFYIKRNIINEIKYSLNTEINIPKNLSLKLHSFSTWFFNSDYIMSNLQPSMHNILEKNNIGIIDCSEDDKRSLELCSVGPTLGLRHKISSTDNFKSLWYENGKYSIINIFTDNPNISMYLAKLH